jgi:hypothetical protein
MATIDQTTGEILNTPNLDKAIYAVQQEIDVIARNDKADIDGKYSYKYAGMPKIWEALKPLLKKHGLLVKQPATTWDGHTMGDFIKTIITHVESGESMTEFMRLVMRREDPQGMGAAQTYAKRYQLGNIFGLITEDDTDAKDHRLATAEQKKEWVRAYAVVSKKANPDANPTYNEFAKFLLEVYGKGINDILAKDSQSVIDTIKAFEE